MLRTSIVIECHKNLISCKDCGHRYELPECEADHQLECRFCHHIMRTRRANWESKVAALTLTGILLFIIANVFPFIGLDSAGQLQQSNILGGVQALLNREEFLLASLVFITIFLFPLLELSGLFYVIAFRLLNIRAPAIGRIVHWLHISRPWSMLEIFLLGLAVASIKLGNFAELVMGPGLFAFVSLVVVLIINNLFLSRSDIWNWLQHENYFVNTENEALVPCHCCEAHVGMSRWQEDKHCPRCGTELELNDSTSTQKTLALLVAATLLYIPSVTLPIMTTTHLGQVTSDTIFSGVLHLAKTGDIPIALVVFVASIIVPIAKLLVLGYLLWNVHINVIGSPRQMARMYRMTEFIGRWSMVDVFVVTMLVALVQFGLIANIEPGTALLCFAAVVVLTMLAAETFDPKLIWQAYKKKHSNEEYYG